MNDDDPIPPGVIAALDQLTEFGKSYATEFAAFHRVLIAAGIPAALAAQMTLAHQAFRYGGTEWTVEPE
jgi:hypothetical protein